MSLLRRASNAAAAVSLLVLAASLVLWARSLLPEDAFIRTTDGQLLLMFSEGRVTESLRKSYLAEPGSARERIEALSARRFYQDAGSGRRLSWDLPTVYVVKANGWEGDEPLPAPRVTRCAGLLFYARSSGEVAG